MLILAYSAALCLAVTFAGATLGFAIGKFLGHVLVVGLICISLVHFILILRKNAAAEREGSVEIGDDEAWCWGMFYCNRNDPALFVQKRSGPGYTVNFGHPLGWPLAVAFFLLVGFTFAVGFGA
jgi:uncharacterized membrane protein